MIEQGTQEWKEERAGKITASRFGDVIGRRKDGKAYLKAREDYLNEIVCEALSGCIIPEVSSAPIRWGNEQEENARAEYEIVHGLVTIDTGFIHHPSIPYIGASPDFLVSHDGLGEIKSPFNPTNHLATLTAGDIPEEHVPQVQGELWCAEREWCDFNSFDPRMPEHLRLFTKRIYRDEKYIKMLEEECAKFWEEVLAVVEKLSESGTVPA